ncbi:MAG: class II aldolase/adducin family protein [Pseudoruegeria sp.]
MQLHLADLDGLIAYSRKLGATPSMIQAAGGNTSIKASGTMWIKASGRWLGDINDQSGFVEMDVDRILEQLDDPQSTDADMRACLRDPTTTARPSVEVPMHAAIPYRYVVHSHCIDVIAIAVQRDAKERLDKMLDGIDWEFLPYIKPGVPLSRLVAKVAQRGVKVFILANHGLIVAADTLDEIDQITKDILDRLACRDAPEPVALDLPEIDLLGTGYRWATDVKSHQIAQSQDWSDLMSRGSFAPDLLVFLGPALPVIDPNSSHISAQLKKLSQAPLPVNSALIFQGVGVAIREDAFAGTEELLRSARDILMRLPQGRDIAYFDDDSRHALLNWDAEKYRQALNTVEA